MRVDSMPVVDNDDDIVLTKESFADCAHQCYVV